MENIGSVENNATENTQPVEQIRSAASQENTAENHGAANSQTLPLEPNSQTEAEKVDSYQQGEKIGQYEQDEKLSQYEQDEKVGQYEQDERVKSPVQKSTSFKNGRKFSNKKFILPPPPRASPTSSSGFPGVSWNKRMGAWLAFYYDQGTRRSRTFHPKYFEMNVEKAKMAAIEFMKNIEKHPKCSLRKNRRERHDWSNSHYIKTSPEFDDEAEGGARRRRRAAPREFGPDGAKRSPLSCSTQASLGELYFEALRPKFLESLGQENVGLGRVARVAKDCELSPNAFNRSLLWSNCGLYPAQPDFVHSQDFSQSSQEFNTAQFQHYSQSGSNSHSVNTGDSSVVLGDLGDKVGIVKNGVIGSSSHSDYNTLSQSDYNTLSQSTDYNALSQSDYNGLNSMEYSIGREYGGEAGYALPGFSGFTSALGEEKVLMGGVDPLEANLGFVGGFSGSSPSLSSPYMSPYGFFRKDDSSLSGSGFRGVVLQPDGQQVMYSTNSYILPIDSN